ncbi:hypothetical protein ACFR97_14525 [Haloplanus litoreus]|uniref:Uncharacterized protein n=1 Tax=Haloplanus litoreus TaxID=767515 RepID=A0ABD5ZYD9_9EURY
MIDSAVLTVKLITLALSLGVAYLAFHGYRRNGSQPMLYVSVGFVFIGVGAICEGLLHCTFGASLRSAALVQSLIVSSGMLFVLMSLTWVSD